MENRNAEVEAAMQELDTASTAAGARVQAHIDEINRTAGEGLTAAQTDAVLNFLGGHKTWLDNLGHNRGAPIPPLPADVKIPGPFRP